MYLQESEKQKLQLSYFFLGKYQEQAVSHLKIDNTLCKQNECRNS